MSSQFNEGATELRFEIENTGDADGTFRGFLEYQYTERPGAFSSVSVGTYYSDFFEPRIVEIPAGETRTVSFTTDYGDDVDIIYRIQPFEAEYRIEARPSGDSAPSSADVAQRANASRRPDDWPV